MRLWWKSLTPDLESGEGTEGAKPLLLEVTWLPEVKVNWLFLAEVGGLEVVLR